MVKENRKNNEEYSELGDQVNNLNKMLKNQLLFLVKTCIGRA
jgi:hypothetical protein